MTDKKPKEVLEESIAPYGIIIDGKIEDRIEIKKIKKRIKDFIFKTYKINLIKELNTTEILDLLSLYEKKFKQLCIKYASRLKKLLNEYEIPLSRLFSFRIDKLSIFSPNF